MTHTVRYLNDLLSAMKAEEQPLPTRWNFWEWLGISIDWQGKLFTLITPVCTLLLLLCVCAMCIIPCVRMLINRLVFSTVVSYASVHYQHLRDEDAVDTDV